MSDRAKVVNRFDAVIRTTYVLLPSLKDQWIIMAVDDYNHFVNNEVIYTPSSNDPDYDDGTFDRELLPGEIEVFGYSMELYYIKRASDGFSQVISTDTKMGRNSGLDGRRRDYVSRRDELETKIQTLYSQLLTTLSSIYSSN